MRVGLATILMLRIGGTRSWDESVDLLKWQAMFGDEHGFANLWLTEHHFTEGGATASAGTLLGHLAAITKRIRLGYSVALLPFNHPLRIAEEMLLVDRLSHGRLDLGVGRGHAPLEVAALCPDPDRAVDMFNDAVDVIGKAFAGKPFKFDGAYWHFPEVQLYPPPYNPGAPHIYMPITSPRSVEFAAQRRLFPLLGSRPKAELKETVGQYAQAARDAGADEAEIDRLLDHASGNKYVAFCESRAEADEQARTEVAYFHHGHAVYQKPVGDPGFHRDLRPVPPMDVSEEDMTQWAIWGNRDDIVDQLRDLEEHGLRQISISLDATCTSPEESRRRMERFARDVLPHVQDVRLAEAR